MDDHTYRVHSRARTVAAEWHSGQRSALYALASSGHVPARAAAHALFDAVASIDDAADRGFLAWYVACRADGIMPAPQGVWSRRWWSAPINRRAVWATIWGGHSYGWTDWQPFANRAALLAWIAEPSPRHAFPCWGEWSSPDGSRTTVAMVSTVPEPHYPDCTVTVGPRGGFRFEPA